MSPTTAHPHTNPVGADPLPLDGFLRLPQVLAIFPVSRSAWWAGIKAGKYPAGEKLGPRTTAWRVDAIRKLIANPPAR